MENLYTPVFRIPKIGTHLHFINPVIFPNIKWVFDNILVTGLNRGAVGGVEFSFKLLRSNTSHNLVVNVTICTEGKIKEAFIPIHDIVDYYLNPFKASNNCFPTPAIICLKRFKRYQ